METILNISAIVALALPILLILVSVSNHRRAKKVVIENQLEEKILDEFILSDPSKEVLVSIFDAKKTFREALRIVLENYREGLSNLNNAPEEAEFFAQQILFAINDLQSNSQKEVMSGLQSLAALGTRDLAKILDEEIDDLEMRWEHNSRVVRMIQLTKQKMSERLENKRTITLTSEVVDNQDQSNKGKKEQRSSVEVSY